MRLQPARWAFLVIVVSLLGLPALWLSTPSVESLFLSPSPVSTTAVPEAARQGGPAEALDGVVAERSRVADLYEEWREGHEARGGDRDVRVTLGAARGLSTASSVGPTPRGEARLDLIDGSVEVSVEGIDERGEGSGESYSAWLVDNVDGPGKSVLPEPGDRMVRLGGLGPDGRLRVELSDDFFRDFELDLVVIAARDSTPVESRLLTGSRRYFERLYTKARTAGAAASLTPERGERNVMARLDDLLRLGTRTALADASSLLVSRDLIGQDVADGGDLFFRGTFGGNGRTCGTCHPAANNQEIGPAFIADLPASDPLFVAERPAGRGGVPGLETPALMRRFGLVLENVDGTEDPTSKFVVRGVPHSLSMSTSITAPDDDRGTVERTGWSGDGAPGSGALRLFSAGAVFQHATRSLDRVAGTDFVLPTDAELDKMEAFMLASGRTNDLDLSQVTLTSQRAAAGLLVFRNQGKCNGCHENAGANSAFTGANNNFDTGVESFRDRSQAVRPHPRDGGFGTVAGLVGNHDGDGDGVPDSFGDGTFNSTPLVEAADTGPFFHNNTIDNLENAVAFYNSPAFNESPAGELVGGISMTPQEVRQVGAFLRVINAGFNVAQAAHRLDACLTLEETAGPQGRPGPGRRGPGGGGAGETDEAAELRQTVDTLLALANLETADAVEVLQGAQLHENAVRDLRASIDAASRAVSTRRRDDRVSAIRQAIAHLERAAERFGTGLDFEIGEGNLMF